MLCYVTGRTCKGIPSTFSVIGNVIDESKVFIDGPRTSSKVHLIVTLDYGAWGVPYPSFHFHESPTFE